ncbi:MFS transporter [Paenibacillus montanisoli]|uniref:MFS transporter n=1 Tax=Paenibacillus montanisoli TaxID=2081970 RepID=A0A328U7L3_9BACL|nr:MFS transporter [Paenibacillus montanisoli]RAP77783.1 MFS transporter [Paenibacillus montanisoli]
MMDNKAKLWTVSFVSLTVCSFLLFLNLQMLLSSFPAYVKNEFHAGDLLVSLVTSVFALAAIVTRFLTALLMRKLPRGLLLMAGLAIALISTGLYALAGSVHSLLALRVLYGIGFGMSSTILPTLVSQIIPVRRMGEGIGYFGLSTSLAMSVGPTIGLNVMKHAGFGTLGMLGTAVLSLAFPILLLTRASSASKTAQPQLQGTANSADNGKRSRFNRSLLLPILLNVLLAITYSGLLSFLALFGEFAHVEQVGLFFLFNAITIIAVRPVSGRIFDRSGHAAVLIPAAVLVVVSMALLSFTHSMPLLIVSALCYGTGFGAIQPTIQAWMLRSSAPEQYGLTNSMFYNSTDFGVAIGALLLGAIASLTDYAVMYRFSALCMGVFFAIIVLKHLSLRAAGSRKQVESVRY